MNRPDPGFSGLARGMLVLWAITAWGGGGPLQVAVVVDDASSESQALGQYYQEQRHARNPI